MILSIKVKENIYFKHALNFEILFFFTHSLKTINVSFKFENLIGISDILHKRSPW